MIEGFISSMLMFAVKLVAQGIKLLIKFAMATGLWITVALAFLTNFIQKRYFPGLEADSPGIFKIYDTAVGVICLTPFVYITLNNLIKFFSKDPTFSLIGALVGRSATKKESRIVNPKVEKTLLTAEPKGAVFGKYKGAYVGKPEEEDGHILCMGGAGSGKSTGVAIPSLKVWKDRIFAIDIKGELYEKTGKNRTVKKVFNPFQSDAYGYDPFYALQDSDNLAQDIKDITLALIPLPPNVQDPFWIESAQNILTGAMIYFYSNGYSFIKTMETIQGTPIKAMIEVIMDSDNTLAKMFLAQYSGIADQTLTGIMTELSNRIMLFATDESIKQALTKKKTISPEDLEIGCDIYVCIPENKLEQWRSLLTLMVNQFLKHFEKRPDMNCTPVLFLLDEFARLGKIETVINGLATLRSKKITIAMFIQSLAQLDMIYGKEARQVICDNCQYKAILKATDADTQENFSRLVGTYDKSKKGKSANFEQYTNMGRGTGVSQTTEERRIVKPEEFATLKDIILLSPFGYFRVKKNPWYKDKLLS